ncbi:MAG: LysM peptidoglycan-binding domain-containing protein [Gammaproteobacteria bacterium]|jgi:membrane-bound lytic murein transglycosylase D
MEYTNKKKLLLLPLLVTGIMLGGCALHAQRQTAVRSSPVATDAKGPLQDQNPMAFTSEDAPVLDDSDTLLNPPFPKLSDKTWLQDLAASETASSSAEDDTSQADDDADASTDDASDDDTNGEDSNLWERIRQGFSLPEQNNGRIARETRWFSHHQQYLDRVAERAQPYLHYIVTQVEQRGMPSELALLPVVESAFQPYAYSSGRAAGIWQFVPATGRRFGLKLNWWYDGRRDIVASTRAALDYLQYLHNTFDGDWLLALAAYNSGEGTVLKAMRHNRRRHRPTDFWSLHLPRETEQYVPRLLAVRNIVAAPEKVGITLKPIADEPYLTRVKIDSQLDLATAAKLADMNVEELRQLNPGFNRWATAPNGPHRLLLPLDKAAIFATQVAELSPKDRVHWVRHRVRRGETLGGIAHHYRTTIRVLRQLNKIRGHLIRAGHYLVIPIEDHSRNGGMANLTKVSRHHHKAVHTVASGDNLWTLARRYGVTVKQLCYWNHLSRHTLLRPGQRIVVKLGAGGITPTVFHMLTAPAEVAKPRKITYRVRRGDSLSRISHRFKVTIRQLRRWNGIKVHEYLQPGQKLTLYVALTADSERG